MTLEVLICCLNDDIKKVPAVLLPPRGNVRYLVSLQYTDATVLESLAVPALHRPDVTVVKMEGKGLARNRNNALRYATGDVLLIADSDVHYETAYFDRILSHFAADTTLDIACFQALATDGRLLRSYSNRSFTYNRQPRGTSFSSVEIAMARRAGLPRFDERFGLGSDYLACGEEEVFLYDAYRKGLHIHYFPEVVVQTPRATTGNRFATDKAVQRSKGAVLCMLHGAGGAFARCLKFALTVPRLPHRLDAMREMARGIFYVLR